MNKRYDTVQDAHHKMFQLIFALPPAGGESQDFGHDQESEQASSDDEPPPPYLPADDAAKDAAKADARNRLFDWLASGGGIFHISGKLGSGKSTLMKYLCDHPSTKAMLETWAGRHSNHSLFVRGS